MAKGNEESQGRAIRSSWSVQSLTMIHYSYNSADNGFTGLVLTSVALIAATRSMRQGNRAQFNRMLRFRVAAQAFTVVGKSIRFPL